MKICFQVVDHEYKIRSVNAKFPGSAHDSHIWRMSDVREHLSTIYRNNGEWILGDNGYPLEPWLLVPFPNPPANNDEIMFQQYLCESPEYS